MKTFLAIDGSLKEARLFLKENWEEGAKCPCCSQLVKLYYRNLNSGMALGLITLYKIAPEGNFIHVPTEFTKRKINNSNTELSKLSYWGLIEEMPQQENSESKTSGHWKITPNGISFVLGKIKLPKYVKVYNGKVLGFGEGETITITEALGNKFNYAELMRN